MPFLRSKQVPIDFQYSLKPFKKYHKTKLKARVFDVSTHLPTFALSSTSGKNFTIKQITSLTKLIKPAMKRAGKGCVINLKVTPDSILTRKPKDIRMGRGKGAPAERVATHKKGDIIFEMRGLSSEQAYLIFNSCIFKIPRGGYIVKQKEW